jgi:hypothetical protein
MTDTNISHALDTTPLLTELAWQLDRLRREIHPRDLTVPEALSLLSALWDITDRLEAEQLNPRCEVVAISTEQVVKS